MHAFLQLVSALLNRIRDAKHLRRSHSRVTTVIDKTYDAIRYDTIR